MAQDFKALARKIITDRNFDRPINAGHWRDLTATPESSSRYIVSDIITASYEFILTRDTKNLMKALKNAKLSKLKFSHCISGDEFTYDEKLNEFLKLMIYFNYEKRSISVKCRVKKNTGKIINVNTGNAKSCPSKYNALINNLKSIEDEYISIS